MPFRYIRHLELGEVVQLEVLMLVALSFAFYLPAPYSTYVGMIAGMFWGLLAYSMYISLTNSIKRILMRVVK